MKTILKRSVALCLSLTLLLTLAPASALADAQPTAEQAAQPDGQRAAQPAAHETDVGKISGSRLQDMAEKPSQTPMPSKTDALDTESPDPQPPATQPPAAESPDPQSPATQPPATQPPAAESPDAQPPAAESPAPQPPATQPPATQPLEVVSYTVRFVDWDGSLIAKQVVEEGRDAVFPAHPTRDGFAPDGWDGDGKDVFAHTTVTALYRPLAVHTLTIHYAYAASLETAHAPYTVQLAAGEGFSKTVSSPAIRGYTPSQAEVVIHEAGVQADRDWLVLYTGASGTAYTVVHRYEKVGGDGYDVTTEQLTGVTGESTRAIARELAGFDCAEGPVQAEIAADGGTRILIRYTRLFHYVAFDAAGGSYVAPIVARYGAALRLPGDPVRPGYTFAGWDKPLPETMPADADLTLTALWTPAPAPYTIAYWQENADDAGFTFVETASAQGTAGSPAILPDAAIQAGRYAQFAFARSDQNVTVNGDGSTIVNVYYARKAYTLTFQARVRRDWVTVATVTAKYGAAIADRFPIPGYEGRAWEAAELYDYPLQTLQCMPGQSVTLRLYDKSSPTLKTIYYYVRATDGAGYDLLKTVTTYFNYITYEEEYHPIAGFTRWSKREAGFDSAGRKDFLNDSVSLYYERARFTLTFYNVSAPARTGQALFGAPLADHADFVPSRPAGVPEGYAFAGWYFDRDCTAGAEVGWTNLTMPASNLIVYARWTPPTFAVAFETDGGSAVARQEVPLGSKARRPDDPQKTGCAFAGWFADAARTTPYLFDRQITADTVVYARWRADAQVSYTVRCVDESGAQLSEPKHASGVHHATYTELAPAIAGYAPDARTQSITLDAGRENTLTFTYRAFAKLLYTVHYVDASGAPLVDSVHKQTQSAQVAERYRSIPGYVPDRYQKSLLLLADESQNSIVFTYSPVRLGAYAVEHYVQNVAQDGYTLKQRESFADKPVASTVTAIARSYEGFAFHAAISRTSGVIPETGALVLKLYYTRARFVYTVRHLEKGTEGPALVPDDTGDGLYAASVSVTCRAIPGYRLAAGEETVQRLRITAQESDNVLVFYYERQADLTYSVEYIERGHASNVLSVIGPVTAAYGSAVRVAAPDVVEKDGVTYKLAGDAVQSVDALTASRVFRFAYEAVTYRVTYDGNGATGGAPPVDARAYKPGDTVTALGRGTLARNALHFLGWSLTRREAVVSTQAEEDAVRGALLATFAMPGSDTTLYAVWAEAAYREYRVVYHAEDAELGAPPVDANRYAVEEQAIVLDPGALQRTGWTFAGWRAKDASGAFAGATLLPGERVRVTGSLDLYAVWTRTVYTVTYYVDGAPYGAPQSYPYEAPVTPPAKPQKAGFTFSGWDGVPQTMPAQNLAVYGVFAPLPVVTTPTPIPTAKPTPAPTATMRPIPTENPTPYASLSPTPLAAVTPSPDCAPTPAPAVPATPVPVGPTNIDDTQGRNAASWALLNLILALATALAAALTILGCLGRRKRKDADGRSVHEVQKHGLLRLTTLLPGVGGILVFLLTENLADPMIWTDRWTPLMLLIAIVQLLLVALSLKREKELEAGAPEDSRPGEN